MEKNYNLNLFRKVAMIIVLAGAMVSLGFMLRAGRNNESILLMALFFIWVASPFVALIVASIVSKQWPIMTRVTLYLLMLVITFGSLLCYSGFVSMPGAKPAFKFLVVPLISWLLLVTVIAIAASVSRKRSELNNS